MSSSARFCAAQKTKSAILKQHISVETMQQDTKSLLLWDAFKLLLPWLSQSVWIAVSDIAVPKASQQFRAVFPLL